MHRELALLNQRGTRSKLEVAREDGIRKLSKDRYVVKLFELLLKYRCSLSNVMATSVYTGAGFQGQKLIAHLIFAF